VCGLGIETLFPDNEFIKHHVFTWFFSVLTCQY